MRLSSFDLIGFLASSSASTSRISCGHGGGAIPERCVARLSVQTEDGKLIADGDQYCVAWATALRPYAVPIFGGRFSLRRNDCILAARHIQTVERSGYPERSHI